MIGFFPTFYDDELIYSLLCRYHKKTGYLIYISTANDLYQRKTVLPDMEFLNHFSDDAISHLCNDNTLETVIIKHTMFPIYSAFITQGKRQLAFEMLKAMEGNFHNLLAIPHIGIRFLRYCPLCTAYDRNTLGETYWHRTHQIPYVNICTKHSCYLENTSIQIGGKQSPNFYDAESYVPKDCTPRFCTNEHELSLSKYIIHFLENPLTQELNISDFLHSHIPSKYISQSGLVIQITQLYNDYANYFKGIDIMKPCLLQKILNGYNHNYYYICQLLVMFNIQQSELLEYRKDESIYTSQLLISLSNKYNIPLNIMKEIAKELANLKFTTQSHLRQKQHWLSLDSKLLPIVKKTIADIENSVDRPQKISIALITKELNLPQKQLYNLPHCKEYILSHYESQEHFWIREINWAKNYLLANGKPVNKTNIIKLININSKDYELCINHTVPNHSSP